MNESLGRLNNRTVCWQEMVMLLLMMRASPMFTHKLWFSVRQTKMKN